MSLERCHITTAPAPSARSIRFDDNAALRELAGLLGAHLKLISRAMAVEVGQRGSDIMIGGSVGPESDPELAAVAVNQLYGLVTRGVELRPLDVEHALRILKRDPAADLASFFSQAILIGVDGRPIVPRSAGQQHYVNVLRAYDIVFGVGPAGTGKTYLAMAVAVAALKRGDVKRIVLTRPAVEAGEKLGFLPGDLTEKVDPYLRPLYDALHDMIPPDRIARMFEKRVIEVAPLAFMRGRTLADAYVVLDEAQNTTREQMKMFLTRLGNGTRMIITGDISQIDLPRKHESGMVQALRILKPAAGGGVDGIGVVRFSSADVVRHPLVAAIIDAYEVFDAERHQQGSA